jgi:hypothetical protein
MTITGFSLEHPVSEQQFLRRELGISWEQVDRAELVRALQRPGLVIISEPEPYVDVLAQLPSGNAVIMMISDEAYASERLALVEQAPAVRSVYRQYDTRLASPACIAERVSQLTQQARRASIRTTALVDLIRVGRATRRRMRSWSKVRVPVHPVPLGYTNTFAKAYADMRSVNSTDSFFALPRIAARDRSVSVTFRGALGQTERQVMVAAARHIPESDIQVMGGDWSGKVEEGGDRYVESLLNAHRALCPPGFINTETFRYYEALLCGATPVEPRTALTHQGIPMARGTAGPTLTQLALIGLRQKLQRDLED